MADIDDSGAPKSRRKLPPLKGESAAEGEENVEEKKPRRKKKKSRGENAEEGPADADAAPTEDTPRRKKKKKPREPKDPAAGDEGEAAPVDGETETPRKKKRKRKPVEEVDSPQSPEEPTTGDDGTEKLVKKKRKKRKTPRTEEKEARFNEGLAAELHDLEDDVIDAGTAEGQQEEEEDEDSPHKLNRHELQSQPEDMLYIEKKNHFRKEDKTKLAKRLAEEEQMRLENANLNFQPSKDTLQFALITHRIFRKFSLICHGLLAGMALAHCVMAFMLLLLDSVYDFLDIYAPLGMPIHEIYYFLFLVCTVSACDRFDLAGMTRPYFIKCITLQNGAISAVIYFVSTMVSLSIVNYDDKIQHYTVNASVHWTNSNVAAQTLNEWSIVNAVRAGGAVLGWVIIALQPSTDKLSSNLLSGDENLLGEEISNVEMKNRVASMA